MYEIQIEEAADQYLSNLPQKSQKIVKDHLKKLILDPFPGSPGDKERLDLPITPPIYRLHIGRSYTAFYHIDTEQKIVRIDIITTIEHAHKLYGRYG